MIEILEADITTLAVDAIVNAANSSLLGGGGVDGAIHRAAGSELLAACRGLGPCPTGEAIRTAGFRLPARFVIHAVGPVWRGGREGEPERLASAYARAFTRALEEPSIRSVAFPAISTGVYGYPRDAACEIALAQMWAHQPRFERIVACVFSREDGALYSETLNRLRAQEGG